MALKDKKMRTDTAPEEQEQAQEPYKSFASKEDFDAEIEKAIAQRGEAQPTITPYYGVESGGGAANGTANGMRSRDRIIDEWQSDAEKIAVIVPDFDFRAALRNEIFKKALTSGKNVFEAYAEMVKLPDSTGRGAIAQNARYAGRGTGEAVMNPSKMSSKDFKQYINNIKEG